MKTFPFERQTARPMKSITSTGLFFILCLMISATSAFAANPKVEIKTNLGAIQVELYPDQSPKTVENFLNYVKDDYYTGTIFHRVIAGFMVQGGELHPETDPAAS